MDLKLVTTIFCAVLLEFLALGGLIFALVYLRYRDLRLAATWPIAVFLFLTRYEDQKELRKVGGGVSQTGGNFSTRFFVSC